MQVLESPADERALAASPEWVADWWMPAVEARPVDVDMPALLVPEPPPAIEVIGRPTAAERAATA